MLGALTLDRGRGLGSAGELLVSETSRRNPLIGGLCGFGCKRATACQRHIRLEHDLKFPRVYRSSQRSDSSNSLLNHRYRRLLGESIDDDSPNRLCSLDQLLNYRDRVLKQCRELDQNDIDRRRGRFFGLFHGSK